MKNAQKNSTGSRPAEPTAEPTARTTAEARGNSKKETSLINTPESKKKKIDPRNTGRDKAGFRSFPRRALETPVKRSRGTVPLCATRRSSRRRKRAARRRGKGGKENADKKPPTLKRARQSLVVLRSREMANRKRRNYPRRKTHFRKEVCMLN